MEHLLQTSEAIRRDGHPRWMIATGFVHDLGKCLCLYGEPQWGVVGDTFPVGCAWSEQIVFPEYFAANPDRNVAEYQTKHGIYEPNCGLENVHMSFGHDGYIAEVLKNNLPDEALYMLRFPIFYAWHKHGAYQHLMNEKDHAMLPWVQKFNPYDLYSKGHTKPDMKELKPFYDDLFAEFFPGKARLVMPAENDEAPAKPLALAILTDFHFWVPFVVLLVGIGVLVICARN